MKITDIYYFSGTHWDREWYQTFQGFRYRLVKMTDELIDYLENEPEFGVYHFDGQTIVLEDYMEIAPENKERLKKLIDDGKVKIGPWYNMPDEFLLSGESLIRNLMTGDRLAKSWGTEPWKFGYVCDIFGHIAQMPQIFSGFNIQYAILGRGTNEEDDAYFVWQSPDGSRCVGFKLQPEGGYSAIQVEVAMNQNFGDTELSEAIKKYVDSEIERSNTPILILMDAHDHNRINKNTLKYLKIIKELYPEARVHHCDLCEAGKKIDELAGTLPIKEGELNKTAINKHAYLHLITNTLSSYYTLKKENDKCQNILEKIIEPLMVAADLRGLKTKRSYVNLGYKYLMKNHPHDSICGCSIEQVHKDMVYRFNQVKSITSTQIEDYLHEDKPQPGNSGSYILKLYNTLPFDRKENVTVSFILKDSFAAKYEEPFGYEEISSFKIIDVFGVEIPYEMVQMEKNQRRREWESVMEEGDRYTITFLAQMPSCGSCEFKIVPSEKPVRYLKKMISGSDYAENEFIKMEINFDGEISVFDKKSKKEYKNLLSFVDDGEIGDGWYHTNPVNDSVVYSHASGCRTEKIEIGATKCIFKITKSIEVPCCIEDLKRGKSRSEKYVKIPITIEVGISENSRNVDVKLRINNTAKDHRLRIVLPTGVKSENYFAGQAYYCNERKTGIDYKTQNWREHEQYEKQMNGIVGMRETNGEGIAFVCANGLHECAAHDDGSLYVTLLRGFGTTVCTAGEEGGQLLGELEYHFLLAPLDRDITYSKLVKMQDCLAVKPLSSITEIDKNYIPQIKSMMKLDGENLNLSIIKQPENGDKNVVIVRIFNASEEKSKGKIIFDRKIKKAYIVNLNEEIEKEIMSDGSELEIELTKWKISTYLIEL